MDPTEAQVKEFWEWCGLKFSSYGGFYENTPYYIYPDGEVGEEPPIDLNNLFEYAVPKVDTAELVLDYRQSSEEGGYKTTHSNHIYIATVTLDVRGEIYSTKEDKDPALALFWALHEVMSQEVCDEA